MRIFDINCHAITQEKSEKENAYETINPDQRWPSCFVAIERDVSFWEKWTRRGSHCFICCICTCLLSSLLKHFPVLVELNYKKFYIIMFEICWMITHQWVLKILVFYEDASHMRNCAPPLLHFSSSQCKKNKSPKDDQFSFSMCCVDIAFVVGIWCSIGWLPPTNARSLIMEFLAALR